MIPGSPGFPRPPAAVLAAALATVLLPSGLTAAERPAPPVASPDTLRLTLDDAVARALTAGIEMRIADADVRIAAGRVREAAADALPKIAGSVTYTRKFDSIFAGASGDTTIGPLFANSPFGAANTWDAQLSGSQVLLSRRVGAALAAARSFRKAAEDRRRETAAQVAYAARRAYLDAAFAGEVLAIARGSLELARRTERDVELLHRQGARAEYDLIRAQVDARNAEPPVVAAANQHATALLELRRILGLPLDQPVALTTLLRLDGDRVPVPDATGLGAPERAGVRAADHNVETYRKALSYEGAARWPDLVASATVSHQAFPSGGLPDRDQFRRAIQGSLKLDFPLVLGLRTFGSVARARAELRRAEAERDQLRRQVAVEAETARQEVWRTLAELRARRGTAALARRAHQIATVRYANGIATPLELSDARLQLQTSEVNEVQAIKDYLAALAGLEFALGRPVPTAPMPLDQLPTPVGDEVK